MRALLAAVKSQVQSEIDWVSGTNVFYADDFDLLPQHVTFPAVGIKDGGQANTLDSAGSYEAEHRVRCCVYVLNHQPETLCEDQGVLDLADEVEAALIDNALSIGDVLLAWAEGVTESELFLDENNLPIARCVVTVAYQRNKQL